MSNKIDDRRTAYMVNSANEVERVTVEHEAGWPSNFWQAAGAQWGWQAGEIGKCFFWTALEAYEIAVGQQLNRVALWCDRTEMERDKLRKMSKILRRLKYETKERAEHGEPNQEA